MEKYYLIKEKFESIKSDKKLNNDKKSVLYANLMTELEKFYKISALPELNSDLSVDITKLYQDISNSRIF